MRIAIGTAQFGMNYGISNRTGQISKEEAKEILNLAWENGIQMLDTAMAYGESEQNLGALGVNNWQIVTKLPAIYDDSQHYSKFIKDEVKKSLERLNTDNLYGLLLHNPQQLLDHDGNKIYQALQEIKSEGFVEKIGVSIYDPVELDYLCRLYHFDIVQAPLNIIDRRIIDTNWHAKLAEIGTELHVRSVFLQGLLLNSPNKLPLKFNRWSSLWSAWDKWLSNNGLNPVEACMRYVSSIQSIDKIIVGIDSYDQLEEILQAVTGALPEIPDDLQSNDIELLNPSFWAGL